MINQEIIEMKNLKVSKWTFRQRIESLKEMDNMLRDMKVASRGTIWQSYGGGLKATENETYTNWERIAKNDEAFLNAIFCYMICTLEHYTLSSFKNVKLK